MAAEDQQKTAEQTEVIGKVILDLFHYPGKDLYSDGEVENRLLDLVKTHREDEFDAIIRDSKDWPTLYHLSSIRSNIVSWIPFQGSEKVLEIGAGPGAITGTLSERCAKVDCVELSKRRSEINAWRHKEAENITIHVGNFEDIEPELDTDYDYIFLIGVLEYAGSYFHTTDPFGEILRRVLKHRKGNGRVVIAIENRFGLKYWAGCAEDHSGRYFDGIESYSRENEPAKTFTRPALEALLQRSGAAQYSFYYPYPDYKFTSVLYSDRRLPQASELNENIRNFDRDRLLLFDERRAYRGITDDGLYPLFANSYEVIVGPSLPVVYCKFSNDRAKEYRIRTEIRQEPGTLNGTMTVRKYPMTPEAAAHVERMEESGKLLTQRYEGEKVAEIGQQSIGAVPAAAAVSGNDHNGGQLKSAGAVQNAGPGDNEKQIYDPASSAAQVVLRVAPCRKSDDGSVEFPFIPGKSLQTVLDESLAFGNGNRFLDLLDTYKELVGSGNDTAISDYDMTFSNILISGNVWTCIDYEWAVKERISAEDLLFRSLLVYYLEDNKRSERCERLIGNEVLLDRIGVPEKEANRLAAEEQSFQEQVTGGVISLGEFRARMGTKVIKPSQLQTKEEIERARKKKGYKAAWERGPQHREVQEFTLMTVQIYFDTGKGYRPEESLNVPEPYREEGIITFPVHVGAEVKRLRVDPTSCPCVCLLRGARVNGKDAYRFFDRSMKMNGRKYTNGSIVYTTSDPNMEWNLKKIRNRCGLKPDEEFDLELTIQMAGLPSTMADAMSRRNV